MLLLKGCVVFVVVSDMTHSNALRALKRRTVSYSYTILRAGAGGGATVQACETQRFEKALQTTH